MVKLSIVLYVSNAEKYLEDSLNSLYNQTFKDYEILFIDDKSTDKSLSFIKKFSKKFNHFKIISLKNYDYSVAVNKCINWVDSKYIYFMDAHNILKPDALDTIYELAQKNKVDFLICDAFNDKVLDSVMLRKLESRNKLNKYTINTFNYTELREFLFEFDCNLENKLYSVDFIKRNNLKLPENLSFSDYVFFYDSLLLAGRIYYMMDYIFEDESLNILSSYITDSRLYDCIEVLNLIIDVFKRHSQFDKYKRLLFNKKFDLMIDRFYRIDEEYKENYFKLMKEELLTILTNKKDASNFMNNLNYHNKKLFEQVLISENMYEYLLLRDTYLERIKYDNLFNHNVCLKQYLNDKVITCTK